MAGPSEQQVQAYELQKVLKNIAVAFPSDHTFLDQIEEGKPEMVSNRAYWFPIDILANGDFAQVDPNGGSYGLGGAIVAQPGQQTAVFFSKAFQYTDLMDWATDSSEKAVTSSPKRNIAMLLDQFRTNLESMALSPGDGSVGSVTSTAAGATIVGVDNPNNFSDQQYIQVFPGVGQAARGPAVQIQSVDIAGKQLFLAGNWPGGTTAGDLLVIKGGTCVANSSLLGLYNQHVDSNTGTWNQINRASFPGKLRTPHVAANGYALSPQQYQLLMALMMRRTSTKNPYAKGSKWVMNLDTLAQWQNAGIVITENIRQQIKGSSSQDQALREAPKTMGDLPIQVSLSAKAQRADLVCFGEWKRWVVRKLSPLNRGGQIFFGIPSLQDGSMTSNTITYLVVGFNTSLTNPVAGGYIDGLPATNGY